MQFPSIRFTACLNEFKIIVHDQLSNAIIMHTSGTAFGSWCMWGLYCTLSKTACVVSQPRRKQTLPLALESLKLFQIMYKTR